MALPVIHLGGYLHILNESVKKQPESNRSMLCSIQCLYDNEAGV